MNIDIKKLLQCRKCNLWKTRRQVVINRGVIPADILFIGEAPGNTEDLKGKAIIGSAGKLLDKMLFDACNIGYTEPLKLPKFCIINTVLCHPTDSFAGTNRQPTKEEIYCCYENIMTLVKYIKPKHIILVGKIAETYYKKEFPESIHIIHPLALLKKGGVKSPNYLMQIRNLQNVILNCQSKLLKRLK